MPVIFKTSINDNINNVNKKNKQLLDKNSLKE